MKLINRDLTVVVIILTLSLSLFLNVKFIYHYVQGWVTFYAENYFNHAPDHELAHSLSIGTKSDISKSNSKPKTESCLSTGKEWEFCKEAIYKMPPISGYFDNFSSAQGTQRNFYFSYHQILEESKPLKVEIQQIQNEQWTPIVSFNKTFNSKVLYSPCRSFHDSCDFHNKFSFDTSSLTPDLYRLYFEFPKTKGLFRRRAELPFVVLPKEKKPTKLLIVYPYWTHQAYSRVGGSSLYKRFSADDNSQTYKWGVYQDDPKKFPNIVSLHRPVEGVRTEHRYHVASPLIKFLKSKNLEYTLISQEDYQEFLKNTSTVVFIGHHEYWLKSDAEATASFLEDGGTILNLSGNTNWWWLKLTKDKKLVLDRELAKKGMQDYGQFVSMPKSLRTDHLLGVSWATGGYPVLQWRKTSDLHQSIKLKCIPSWLKGIDLEVGESFGKDAKPMRVEVDGVPLVQSSSEINPFLKLEAKAKIRVVGVGWSLLKNNFQLNKKQPIMLPKKKPIEIGIISEYDYQSRGRVINFSTVGATATLEGDSKDNQIFQSMMLKMITYLDSRDFDNSESYGCHWHSNFVDK